MGLLGSWAQFFLFGHRYMSFLYNIKKGKSICGERRRPCCIIRENWLNESITNYHPIATLFFFSKANTQNVDVSRITVYSTVHTSIGTIMWEAVRWRATKAGSTVTEKKDYSIERMRPCVTDHTLVIVFIQRKFQNSFSRSNEVQIQNTPMRLSPKK